METSSSDSGGSGKIKNTTIDFVVDNAVFQSKGEECYSMVFEN
jgi:hypothetical protein